MSLEDNINIYDHYAAWCIILALHNVMLLEYNMANFTIFTLHRGDYVYEA